MKSVQIITFCILCAVIVAIIGKRIELHRQATESAQADPQFQVLQFDGVRWQPYQKTLKPNKRVLIVVPGVLEPLATGFAPSVIRTIQVRGDYQSVLGISYNWSSPATNITRAFSRFLNTLPPEQLDIEGHSYGSIQAIAAINASNVTPHNVVFLGSPLRGTPLAAQTPLTNALLALPGTTWNGNFGRFAAMEENGAALDLLPGSPVLQQMMTQFSKRIAARHINVILVAGTDERSMGMLANMYLRTFGLECWSCSIANDGVIPESSAFGRDQGVELSAHAHAKAFTVLHADMERDPEIIEYVGQNLTR